MEHKSSRKKKRKITDSNILEVFALRDKLLESTSDEAEKEKIHMACKGLFSCPKFATDAEKSKCFTDIKKKLEAMHGHAPSKSKKAASVAGGRKHRKTRSKSRSKSRSRSRSKSRR